MRNNRKHTPALVAAAFIIAIISTAFIVWGRSGYPANSIGSLSTVNGQENSVYNPLQSYSYEPGYTQEASSHVPEYTQVSCTYEPENSLYDLYYPSESPPEPPALPYTNFPQQIPVLAYHSILPTSYYYPNYVNNPWVLSLDEFYLQMRYLYENSFTTITSDHLIDYLFNNKGLPENPIILTFDDGYLDNALFAAPIMRQFGFTGMQFLITGLLQEYARPIETNPLQHMSITEIMATLDVFEFGSHTHAMHSFVGGTPLLVSESVEAIKEDILHSFQYPLTFTTGFAYPFGRHSSNARQALQEAGVRFAFTTQWGYLNKNTNPLLIPRFSITGNPQGWSMEKFSDIVWGRWS